MDGGKGTKPIFTIGRDFPVRIENMTLEDGRGDDNGADVQQAGEEETVLDDVLVNGGNGEAEWTTGGRIVKLQASVT